ncbi:dynein axonemal assembly factor 1 homolog [Procambarus clarkii]|uniref:dynein axonemal assembly factor 1 homolog n=1 Tax=Procambarus clarkii TaxID=6728 RepID=UPI0037440B8E
MTKEAIKQLCKEHDLYTVPALNDVLYLHFKGYTEIENLEEYTGLRCLWLENNGIRHVSGLHHLQHLRSLHLHNNLLTSLSGLQGLQSLVTLNVSFNMISNIDHICGLPRLETLQAGHNRLSQLEAVARLASCPVLSCLDLSHNGIHHPDVVQVLGSMRGLRVVQLTGNPAVREVRAYRNTLVVTCANLTYLDDRPVFPVDRAAAEAWSEGGLEAERRTRREWAERDYQRQRDCVNDVLKLRERVLAARAARGPADTPSQTDMGIYVENTGTEKIYALTPAAKAWAQSRVQKLRARVQAENQAWNSDDIVVHDDTGITCSDSDVSQSQDLECQEEDDFPDDKAFNKLLENLSDETEFSGLKRIQEIEESNEDANVTGVREAIDSKGTETVNNLYSCQEVVSQSSSKDLKEVIDDEQINLPSAIKDSVEEPLVSEVLDKSKLLPENSSILSKSEASIEDNCSSCSSACAHKTEDDQLLFNSCHNFLKIHSSASEDGQSSSGLTRDNEELLGEIWDAVEVVERRPSLEVDSDAEGQAYLRQLVAHHNSHQHNDSDIEEMLENMEFETDDFESVYERHSLVGASRSQGTPDDSQSDDDDDVGETLNNGVTRNMNGVDNNNDTPPAGVPVFGERWMEEARRRIIEDEDWQEEVEASSNSSEQDESVDELNVETPDETSLVEEESSLADGDSHESLFEEESVSSISPIFEKDREVQRLLECNSPLVKSLSLSQIVKCDALEPTSELEDQNTSSSCSSLSPSSLSDSPAHESTGVVQIAAQNCSIRECKYTRPDTSRVSLSYNNSADSTFDLNTVSDQKTCSASDGSQPRETMKELQLAATDCTDDTCILQPRVGHPSSCSCGHQVTPRDAEVGSGETSRDMGEAQHVTRDNETREGMRHLARNEETRGRVGHVTRDATTLAGSSWAHTRHRESIFNTRDALRSSHEAFVRGHNIGKNLFVSWIFLDILIVSTVRSSVTTNQNTKICLQSSFLIQSKN